MSTTSALEAHDSQLVTRVFEQLSARCGLSPEDIGDIIQVENETGGRAELQFIELIEHLTAIVGCSVEVQSNWFKTENLDLGETPLSLMKAPSGVKSLRDYLAGQRHRC